MSSTPSSGGTAEFCNPLLGNGSVNTFQRIGPCFENGDVINNRGSVFSVFKISECRRKFGSGQLRVSPEELLVPKFQTD
jgi:hypothetical protein